MPTFAVDWDGTLVENVYPEQGDWLPGAKDALYLFDRLGTVIVHSVRIAPVMPAPGQPFGEMAEFVDYDPSAEVAYIQRMLDEAGLGHIEIWQRPFKPPATFYIDDKAIRFDGDWPTTIEAVMNKLTPSGARGIMAQQALGTATDDPLFEEDNDE